MGLTIIDSYYKQGAARAVPRGGRRGCPSRGPLQQASDGAATAQRSPGARGTSSISDFQHQSISGMRSLAAIAARQQLKLLRGHRRSAAVSPAHANTRRPRRGTSAAAEADQSMSGQPV